MNDKIVERLLRNVNHPLLRGPWLMWDAAMFVTGNVVEAVRFYHEASLEILELIGGA